MAGLIKFFYNRKRFFFKVKNTVFYYFRFWLIGIFVGLVTNGLWGAFVSSDLKKNFIQLDNYLLKLFGNLVYVYTNWVILTVALFSALALFLVIVRSFQPFLRASLIYLGFLSCLSLSGNVFWRSPAIWNNWRGPQSFLTVLYYLSFWIIILDIGLIITKTVIKQIKSSVPGFVLWIRKITDAISKDPKLWWYKLIGRDTASSEPSDEPLQKLSDIKLIRESVRSEELFQIFERSLADLNNLINYDDPNKIYTKSICLDGRWGSGKTSLINIARNGILSSGNDKIIWIDFYPWNFTNRTELIKDFFDTLNEKLVDKYKIDLQPSLEPYVDLITPLIESTGLFGSFKSILTKVPFLAHKNLNNLKEDICKKLRKIPDKIVIVLDDLDRLEPKEVETVLQLVRQLSNFPNILFILPFDYKRIADLIVDKKGSGYADFLGKIINSRIILEAYSYKELESIFISSIKKNPTPKKTEALKDIFSVYVKERNRSRFEEIRKREGTTASPDPTLTPAFIFANDLFRILYPPYHLKDHYNTLKDRIKELLNFFLGDLLTNGNLLESEIFEKLSLIKKIELANKFSAFKPQIDSDMATSGANPDELNALNKVWDDFIKSLNEGEKHKTIEGNLNIIIGFQVTSIPSPVQINALPNIKIALEQIGQDLAKYKVEFDNNSDYHTKIKSWLVQDITPRHVKELARKEIPYVARIIEAIDEEKAVAVNVAKLQ